MAWGKNGTPDTLSGTGDTMTISDLSANKFNQILIHSVGTGQTYYGITFNNNTNSVYAARRSPDGGSDLTSTSQTNIGLTPTIDNHDSFTTVYLVSISGKEKLLISFSIFNGQNGVGNAPERREVVGKFVPSPDADITRVDITNGGTGDFLVDSNLSVIGSDITPAAAVPAIDNVQDNSLFVEKDTASRYWLTPQTVDTEEAFSFTTTDTVNALWGNRILGMKLLSGHSGLNKYIKKIKTYHPTNPTGSRLTTGTLYHVILDSSGTEIARSAGVSASSVSNNSWAETTLSTPVKLEENYTVGLTISTGDANTYLGTAINNNSSSPTNTTRYYKDEFGTESTATTETILMVFDSDPATGLSIPSTWINEFGISNGLIFGGVTGSYADYSDSQYWNGVSWTAGGNLTGNRANGASAGTGNTSARYVNGYNASPAPYPNSNRNESYNGTSWTSDTNHPDATNNKQNNGCGTADNMLVGNGHSNGTGDVNNWYKWTGSWTSVTASGITGHDCSLSGTLTSAIQTKTTSSKTWNGTAWTSVSASGVSRSSANASGTSSSDAFRVMSTGSPPTIVSSELWNGTAWTASGNAVTAKSEAGSTNNFSNNMMIIGGQDPSATQSLSTQEYRKGVFTTGSSISGSRRLSGASG